jgi:hypothetical protein
MQCGRRPYKAFGYPFYQHCTFHYGGNLRYCTQNHYMWLGRFDHAHGYSSVLFDESKGGFFFIMNDE